MAIDSVMQLREELEDKFVIDAQLEERSGDLRFLFSSDIEFQVFNFTGYEVWEIHFPNGNEEFYSPYAR